MMDAQTGKKGRTIITYGVFDLFHRGHESLLRRAKALGDYLIVGVTTDQYAYQRGKLCLVDTLETRLEHVRGCSYVDEVIIEDRDGQKADDIVKYNVDIFAIGDDWFGKFDYLKSYCQVVYLERTAGISSTALRGGTSPDLKMGLIGCGRIAGRFMQEVGYLRDIKVTALYHPMPDESATVREFLGRHTAVAKVRTQEKLFDVVDAVYIASPHGTHYEYAKAALNAGVHVLCEKPLALAKSQAEELFELAEKNGCVLMEAIKTAYCPGFLQLISIARSGEIGDIVDVEGCFTRLTNRNCREWTDVRYGGSFTEFGSYVMLPIVKLLGTENLTWSFSSVKEQSGVDCYTRLFVRGKNQMAAGKTGLGVKSEGQLVISGTKGYIYVPAPWWKTQYFEIRYEDPNVVRRFVDEFQGDGLRYELADFWCRVQGYEGREYKLLPRESVKMAEMIESFLQERDHDRFGKPESAHRA